MDENLKNILIDAMGSNLSTLRSRLSLSQEELAELLGVSNRSISRWENGTTMPDFDLLIELAKYYDVEVGEILDGERRTDNMDAKMETLKELFCANPDNYGWLGYQKLLEADIRRSSGGK